MTEIQFYRGPYDGLILDAEGLRRYCHPCEARKRGHTRHFFLMPPLAAWEAVVCGWTDDETIFDDLHTYELVTTGEVRELHYRASGKFREVMRQTA